MYFPSLDAETGALRSLRLVPLKAHGLSLRQAGSEERQWLSQTLSRASERFGVRVLEVEDGLAVGPSELASRPWGESEHR